VLDQKCQERPFLGIEGKPLPHHLHQWHPAKGVIAALTLPNIMQQSGKVEDAPMVEPRKEAAQPQAAQPRVLILFQAVQPAHGSQEVLVHRVEMIHIVLHSKAHRHEFRQKGLQEARFQHHLQHPKSLTGVQQDVEKLPDHGGVSSGRLVESTEVVANDTAGLMMKVRIRLGRLPEELHQQARLLVQQAGLEEMEMAPIKEEGTGQDASSKMDAREFPL